MNLSLFSSNRRVFLLAILFMAIALFFRSYAQFNDVASGQFPNPDSYYKLVLLEGYAQGNPINFNPRDNTPDGNWIHWSLPHSQTVWQLHKVFNLFGLDTRPALIWAGASITIASMLLLAALVAAAILSIGTRKATLATALLMASSLPLAGYGQLQQITHHIFMLAPLAGTALCITRAFTKPSKTRDTLGGLLTGLALWISPETMPLVVIMVVWRMAIRLQFPETGKIWPMAAGLTGMVLAAWLIDPPPPTFSTWSLDHISLAWLLFACLTSLIMLFADWLASRAMTLQRSVAWLAIAGGAIGATWLLATPGATAGPSGLLPDELKSVWWDQIQELKSVESAEKAIAMLTAPTIAGLLAMYWAGHKRLLWLGVLGISALLYAILSSLHIRMGAAGALISALAFGFSISHFPVFANKESKHSKKAQIGGILLVLLGPLQLFAIIGIALLTGNTDIKTSNNKKNSCAISDIAPQLNVLPASVMLVTSSAASELLYRTHHKVIAGNYHHNVDGLLDVHRALLDTEPWEMAKAVIKKRNVEYILVCNTHDKTKESKSSTPVFYNWLADSNPNPHLAQISLKTESQWYLFQIIKH